MLHKEIVTLPNTDLEVEVVFYYSPAVRGRQYMPNGDPGYEDEPAELEIEQIIVNKCCIMEALSEDTINLIEERLLDQDYNSEY